MQSVQNEVLLEYTLGILYLFANRLRFVSYFLGK